MEKLIIEHTLKSPSVNFDPNSGLMKIEGRSILEDPSVFYEDLFTWMEEYVKSPAEKTHVEIKLEYINSSSSKFLTGLLQIIEKLNTSSVDLIWYYEEQDESIQEIGTHFRNTFPFSIKMVEYSE